MSSESSVDTALFAPLIPLNSLRPENQRDLARKASVEVAPAGTQLFGIGDSARAAIWVLEGTVSLQDADGQETGKIQGGQAASLHRLAHQSPRRANAVCSTQAKVLKVDAGLLDVMLTWDQTGSFEVNELTAAEDDGGDDWMAKLLTLPTFQAVPPANLQAMFMRLERVTAKPSEVIVKQGADGDYFYVIIDGKAMVTREQPNQKAVRLAELSSGACFGEEALISDSKRNATVTMLTPGSLMRLSKTDFQELLNEPLARKLGAEEARERVRKGEAVWLDVRLPSEFQAGHLPDAVNIPLYMLRPRLAMLAKDKTYIACCDTGRRSSVAVFVLTQKGYDAYLLDGGIPEFPGKKASA